MHKTDLKIICRDTKPTDDPVAMDRVSLACEKFNGAQYYSKEELQERVGWLEQQIADKKAHPAKCKARPKNDSAPRYKALVAEVDGKIVGYTVCHTLSEDEKVAPEAKTELDAIYVLPEYQSKGVGFALWQATIERLQQQGETAMQLAVVSQGPEDEHGKRGPGNVNAMKFYKRQGCIFLDKTRQWKSQSIPPSKICTQQRLLKRFGR